MNLTHTTETIADIIRSNVVCALDQTGENIRDGYKTHADALRSYKQNAIDTIKEKSRGLELPDDFDAIWIAELTHQNPRVAVEQIHSEITTSEIFRLDGAKIDLPAKLIELADAINAYPGEDEHIWYVGEDSYSLDSLVVGAYWALTEWHDGQSSDTYAAMCALGNIFNPGHTSAPTESDESGEWDTYNAINKHFESLSVAGL